MPIVSLTRPKHIVQVFSTHHHYRKEEYRNSVPSVRRLSDWKEKVTITSGYVQESQLFLSEPVVQDVDFPKADVLVLRENAARSLIVENTRRAFELFKLGWKENELWLSLNYTGELSMGYPRRENFDIVPLHIHKPVRICLNGRTWHSMTGRRAHTYHEWDFVFDYLGRFDEASVTPALRHITTLDCQAMKLIDLRKDLY